MDLGLKDKRVLVTGSTRGIGLAIATGFLEEGARVVVTSRNRDDLTQLLAGLSHRYSSDAILSSPCDFTDAGQVSALKGVIEESFQGLDVLVANVGSGISVPDPIPDRDHFRLVFAENYEAAMNAAREFLPLLVLSKGNIIFISSIAGVEAIGAPMDYSVAKTAVLSFSKNLARQVARDGVRVNCVAPGNIYFKGGSWDSKMKKDPERITKLIESTVPMTRFGRPEEIANAVLFLGSERASFITGACLIIDGGQTVTLY